MNMKKYFFTMAWNATKKERDYAVKKGFTLVNGLYGHLFNKQCKEVSGCVPEHLKSIETKIPSSFYNEDKLGKIEDPELR